MTACADIAVAILAAGQAKRFGSDKLMAPIHNIPMGLHVAQKVTEIGFGWRFAICAINAPIAERYAAMGLKIISNAEPELGQSRSLHLAVLEAQSTPATALLVVLADMPFVTRAHLDAIAADVAITASTDGKATMPPALFPRAIWPQLLAATGDGGARDLLRGANLVKADVSELLDIDVVADLHTPRVL